MFGESEKTGVKTVIDVVELGFQGNLPGFVAARRHVGQLRDGVNRRTAGDVTLSVTAHAIGNREEPMRRGRKVAVLIDLVSASAPGRCFGSQQRNSGRSVDRIQTHVLPSKGRRTSPGSILTRSHSAEKKSPVSSQAPIMFLWMR